MGYSLRNYSAKLAIGSEGFHVRLGAAACVIRLGVRGMGIHNSWPAARR